MIQRIQTIFLVVATALLISLFFSEMAYSPFVSVRYNDIDPLFIMNIFTTIVCLVSIFLYKNRVLQTRLNVFNTIILFVYQGWILYYFFKFINDAAFSITAMFPLAAAILTILAIKYIRRDEALVQATKRLRR